MSCVGEEILPPCSNQGLMEVLNQFLHLIEIGHKMENKKPKRSLTILQWLSLLGVIGIVLTIALNYLR